MGTGRVVWTDLAVAFGADQCQFRATERAAGVVLADGSTALGAEGLAAGVTFWRAGRDGYAALGTASARLESAAQAGGFLGQEHQVALGAEARATFRAGASCRHETNAADGANDPAHDHVAHAAGQAAGRRALLVRHRLLAIGAALGSEKDRLVAVGAAAGKDEAAVGADLGPGQKLHLASGAGKGECQLAVGALLDGFVVLIRIAYGGAAAGAEGLPAGGAGRVAQVNAGATVRAGQGLS